MNISENVRKLIHNQITKEFESSYMYLGFANWCETKSFFGFAKFFFDQFKEEQDHALKFLKYLNDRNCLYIPEPIDVLFSNFENKGIVDFITASLLQEQKVTEAIYNIYDVAIQDKDHISKEFISWFLNEQKEEEKKFNDLLVRSKFVGKDPTGFIILDKELNYKN